MLGLQPIRVDLWSRGGASPIQLELGKPVGRGCTGPRRQPDTPPPFACPFPRQWDDFMELGNSIPDIQLDGIMLSQRANQCAVLIYTSGTVGKPKGVMLSHDNVSHRRG